MGAVDTTYTFTATDTITSTKMNNIIDQTTITTDAIIGTTLEVATGKLKVRAAGITSNELATGSVTSNAIADDTIVDADINSAAAISLSKLGSGALPSAITVASANIVDGTITASDIADSSITAPKLDGAQTGTAPIFGVRAWVVFDMTRNSSGGSDTLNTNRFIYSSGNVGGVTKIDTGRFQVNFTTAMPNANYMYFGSGRSNTGDNSGDVTIGRPNSTGSADGAKTTSSIKLDVIDAGASFFNSPEVCVSIIG